MAESIETASVMTRRNWIHDLADFYDEEVFEKANPEVMTWTLVGKDWHCLSIIFGYVMFINYIGPSLMKNRAPFDLRWLMVPYNIFLVIANFCIFLEFARIRWTGGDDVKCDTLPTTSDPRQFRMAEITWYFYITKYLELSDTIFFVLRKKDRQLSRLHKFHHTTVPIIILLLLRSQPGGYNSFFPLANAFVHCIMYTYYGISALGDDVTIHLKFKKYVTMTQMIQFILVLCYFISRPFYGCHWNFMSGVFNLTIAGSFFLLFLNFYYHEYHKSQDSSELNGNAFNRKKK